MKSLNLIINGSPGSGKTSILNMLIKNYYNENFTKKNIYDNVLFINNSKDQGINYFRTDVKTFCQTPSTVKNTKKIIAIDDIDNLNEQSQQVFRNYIDKYKNNVLFIFTCSNLQKIIESIQSRQTILKITSVNNEKMEHICNQVIENEDITITEEAKIFLINISNFSIRVMFNYLEKFKMFQDDINYDNAIKLCTNINFEDFEKYIKYVKNKEINNAIKILLSLHDDGYSVMDILDSFFVFIKMTPIVNEKIKYEIISYLCSYIHIFHDIHEHEIELAFFTNNIVKTFNTSV
tara:strand:- start:18 stop:893 length:876 start_codon:yes stop_codon:yes gene_type:complete